MRRKRILYDNTKWVGIHLPLELDREVKRIQEKFEDAGKSKPNKADLCVDLIQKGLEVADFDELVKIQEEIQRTS